LLPSYTRKGLQHTTTHCNTLQHTTPGYLYVVATLYSKRSATHCNTLQHAGTRCNRVSIRRCHHILEKVCCMSSRLVFSSLQCVAVCFAIATMRRLKKRLLSYRVHVRESMYCHHPIQDRDSFQKESCKGSLAYEEGPLICCHLYTKRSRFQKNPLACEGSLLIVATLYERTLFM